MLHPKTHAIPQVIHYYVWVIVFRTSKVGGCVRTTSSSSAKRAFTSHSKSPCHFSKNKIIRHQPHLNKVANNLCDSFYSFADDHGRRR